MKNLFQITTVLFLLVQTIGHSQTENTENSSNKQDTSLKKQNIEAETYSEKFQSFIGEYILEEAGFVIEIVTEDNKMYIVTSFSKDLLLQKNKTTLHELTRGVDLELIKDNKNALKFAQNGYETIIKRVNPKTEK